MLKKILDENDIIFLIEHWLNLKEDILVSEFAPNFNIFFESFMDGVNGRKVRPFGGKCWLVRKEIIVN